MARLSAAINAASSTSEPRPTLQKIAPGFIAANAAASNRFSVSAVPGALTTTASQRAEHVVQVVGAEQLVDRGVLRPAW